MNGVSLEFVNIPTPLPSSSSTWISSSEEERINLIKSLLKNFSELEKIEIRGALNNGQVSVEINETTDASERGSLLLDIEAILKKELDNGISIWHIPIGDKNSLRNLRGIEVVIKEDTK
tara:strand:- start:444 stop:800 length:357 start_codon:yes stop_codon:yes gene_type:complete